jgi:hypothetical protein
MVHELILRAGDVVRIGVRRMRVVRVETDRVIVEVFEDGEAVPPGGDTGGQYALVFRDEARDGQSSPRVRVELQAI